MLDGDPATIWQSKWAAPPAPLPHSVTVDLHTATAVAGLRYLPRQDSTPNGRIGQYQVALSSDGTTWTAPVAGGCRPTSPR